MFRKLILATLFLCAVAYPQMRPTHKSASVDTARAANIADSLKNKWVFVRGDTATIISTKSNDALKAPLASPTFTGTVTFPTPFTLGATSVTPTGTELNYVDGVTSAIQTQLDAKSPLASPTFTGTVTIPSPFTLGATSVTTTGAELNYIDNVTSDVQTQINGKAASAHNHATGDINSGTLALARGGLNADISGTGGTGQVLKQTTLGGSVTVGTLSLASSDFANQGTTTTVLHGNASGNPSFGAVSLTTDVTGTLPTGNGGTGNTFFAVTGPTTSTKTFTFPDATATVLTTNAAVTEAQGGTGESTYTLGDVLYSDASNSLAKLSGNTTSTLKFLTQTGNGSTSAAPVWNAIAAGDLPSGIDATKIAGGSVTSTEFDYLGTITSNVQTQINSKEATLTNSAGLASALSDETGTGLAVFGTSPTFVTKIITPVAELGTAEPTAVAGTNQAGTDLIINSGKGTGTGALANTYLQSPAAGTASGTSSHTLVNRVLLNGVVTLTSGVAVTIATITVGAEERAGGEVIYSVEATDATDHIVASGSVYYAIVNKAGTYTSATSILGTEAQAKSDGADTIGNTFAFAASSGNLQITSTLTGITATTFRITYTVLSNSHQQVTIP